MKNTNIFWNWFQDNLNSIESLIFDTPANQRNISFWFSTHLKYYCDNLDFMIIYSYTTRKSFELIITANSNDNNFLKIEALIKDAPYNKMWSYTVAPEKQPIENQLHINAVRDCIIPEITLKKENHFQEPILDQNTHNDKVIWLYLKRHQILCNSKNIDQIRSVITKHKLTQLTTKNTINWVQLSSRIHHENNIVRLQELQFYLETIQEINITKSGYRK